MPDFHSPTLIGSVLRTVQSIRSSCGRAMRIDMWRIAGAFRVIPESTELLVVATTNTQFDTITVAKIVRLLGSGLLSALWTHTVAWGLVSRSSKVSLSGSNHGDGPIDFFWEGCCITTANRLYSLAGEVGRIAVRFNSGHIPSGWMGDRSVAFGQRRRLVRDGTKHLRAHGS